MHPAPTLYPIPNDRYSVQSLEWALCNRRKARQMVQVNPPPLSPANEPENSRPAVEAILAELREGDEFALQQLFVALHAELHAQASKAMEGQGKAHTLQPTALLNEAYLRIVQAGRGDFQDRRHFLLMAAQAMRHVLVDHYRKKTRLRRPQGRIDQELDLLASTYEQSIGDLDALDLALAELAEKDEVSTRLVELRFFGGLGMGEISRILDVPVRTLERRWQTLRAWLLVKLS